MSVTLNLETNAICLLVLWKLWPPAMHMSLLPRRTVQPQAWVSHWTHGLFYSPGILQLAKYLPMHGLFGAPGGKLIGISTPSL